MANTTVYLIRHSVRFDLLGLIDGYNTVQDINLKREKIILSVEGEKRSEKLANEKELQNIDAVYVIQLLQRIYTTALLKNMENHIAAANVANKM